MGFIPYPKAGSSSREKGPVPKWNGKKAPEKRTVALGSFCKECRGHGCWAALGSGQILLLEGFVLLGAPQPAQPQVPILPGPRGWGGMKGRRHGHRGGVGVSKRPLGPIESWEKGEEREIPGETGKNAAQQKTLFGAQGLRLFFCPLPAQKSRDLSPKHPGEENLQPHTTRRRWGGMGLGVPWGCLWGWDGASPAGRGQRETWRRGSS